MFTLNCTHLLPLPRCFLVVVCERSHNLNARKVLKLLNSSYDFIKLKYPLLWFGLHVVLWLFLLFWEGAEEVGTVPGSHQGFESDSSTEIQPCWQMTFYAAKSISVQLCTSLEGSCDTAFQEPNAVVSYETFYFSTTFWSYRSSVFLKIWLTSLATEVTEVFRLEMGGPAGPRA